MKVKKKYGRPSKFKKIDPAIIELLARSGYTDVEMAAILGVTERTWNNWKKKNEVFFQSLKDNKGIADGRIVASLFQRAEGYSHPEDKIFLGKDGAPVVVHTTKHYPPDTAACIYWLKNRRSSEWKERREFTPDDDGNQFDRFVDAIANRYQNVKEENEEE